jgi:hypothetical protein
MPDFTVIDGGGKGRPPPDYDADMARQHMNTLIVEILRAVARGNDYENRVGRALIEMYNRMAATSSVPIYEITSGPIAEAHAAIDSEREGYQMEVAGIVLASLKVARCTSDGFAKGRKSQAEDRFDSCLRERMRGDETRSRENCWSYLTKFMADNFRAAPTAEKGRHAAPLPCSVRKQAGPKPAVFERPKPSSSKPRPFDQNDLKELRKAIKAGDKKRIVELTAKIGQPR